MSEKKTKKKQKTKMKITFRTFSQGQVLHHPPGHVAGPLVRDELEHAAVRGAPRGAVLGAEEHGVLDVEGGCFFFFLREWSGSRKMRDSGEER